MGIVTLQSLPSQAPIARKTTEPPSASSKTNTSLPDQLLLEHKGWLSRLGNGALAGSLTGASVFGTMLGSQFIYEGLKDAIVLPGEKLAVGQIVTESAIVGGGTGIALGGLIGGVSGAVIGSITGSMVDDPKQAALIGGAIGLVAIGGLAAGFRGKTLASLALGFVGASASAVSSYYVAKNQSKLNNNENVKAI